MNLVETPEQSANGLEAYGAPEPRARAVEIVSFELNAKSRSVKMLAANIIKGLEPGGDLEHLKYPLYCQKCVPLCLTEVYK
jgi:hypothetical protein